ncbi:MAG: sensor histidine kinase [Gaiellaceae bacterium]
MLALARSDAGPASPIDVVAVVTERVETWQALAQEHGVALVADTDSAAMSRAAPERLARIIDNLVANALEAAPGGSTVTVFARTAGELVEVRVRDEGPGLGTEDRARAFDRFWRARSGDGGSGLGLAIVRKVAEADAATVELDEAPAAGSTLSCACGGRDGRTARSGGVNRLPSSSLASEGHLKGTLILPGRRR